MLPEDSRADVASGMSPAEQRATLLELVSRDGDHRVETARLRLGAIERRAQVTRYRREIRNLQRALAVERGTNWQTRIDGIYARLAALESK